VNRFSARETADCFGTGLWRACYLQGFQIYLGQTSLHQGGTGRRIFRTVQVIFRLTREDKIRRRRRRRRRKKKKKKKKKKISCLPTRAHRNPSTTNV
jgi:hypothetical protein